MKNFTLLIFIILSINVKGELIENISCQAPIYLDVIGVKYNSAVLVWFDFDEAEVNSWEVEYGPVGFITGTGTIVPVLDHPFTLMSLEPETSYSAHVRAICGENSGDDDSFWSLFVDFTTLPDYCGGTHFLDSGGEFNDYHNDENTYTRISPTDDFNQVTVQFNSFELADDNFDFLRIFNGPNIDSDPIIGTYYSTNNPGTITSTHPSGILTFLFRSNQGNQNSSGWDATIICETATCIVPSNLISSNATFNSIDLSWDVGDTENNWEIEYGLSGFTQGNGIAIQTSTNQVHLTNLDSRTYYDVYYRANCGTNIGDDDSLWVGPILFSTIPNYCNGEHFYDSGGEFEDYSTNEQITTTIYPTDGFNRITAQFNSFNTLDYLKIYDGPNTSVEYYLGQFVGSTIPPNFTSTHPTGALTFYFSSNFSSNSDGSEAGWDATIVCDNICHIPSNLTVNNITPYSTDLSWTEGNINNSWEIEYGIDGFNQGTGTIIQSSTDNYNLSNLISDTSYDIYLREVCDESIGNNSLWIGPISFTTLKDFCIDNHFYDSGGEFGNYANSENSITTIYPPEGFNLITVRFNSFKTEAGYDKLRIFDGPNTDAPLIGQFSTSIPGTFTSTHSTGALTFWFTSNHSSNYSGWDATVICGNTTCPDPSNFIATNLNSNSYDLSWTEGSIGNNWDLEYGLHGFEQGNGTIVQTHINSYHLANLEANTNYDVYLRENCDLTVGDYSNWIGPISFITHELTYPTNLTVTINQQIGEATLNWIDGSFYDVYEDFNDQIADNWIPVRGNWSITGNLSPTNGLYTVVHDDSHNNSSSYYNEDFSNFELEVKMRKTYESSFEGMLLYFNGNPNNTISEGFWRDGYELTTNTSNQWFLRKFEDGTPSFIQDPTSSTDLSSGINNWDIIKVIYLNGVINIYFNDILQGSYFDETFTSGKIGVSMYDEPINEGLGVGEFEYIKIKNLDSNSTANSRNFLNYSIYRNNSLIGTETTNFFTDNLNDFDIYNYQISANYDDGNESALSNVAAITYDGVITVDDFEIFNFDYYPNPTKNILTLKADKVFTEINIYSILGEKILTITPNNKTNLQINLSKFNAGIYIMNVSIENKTSNFRIIKK